MKKTVSILKSAWIVTYVLFSFVSSNAQTYNLVAAGNMENSNWTGIPGNTNLSVSFEASLGINSTTALKTVTTSMGGDSYYILRCEEFFHLNESDKVTVSFWAKGSATDMRLQPWVQEADRNEWMNFGDAYLTTTWKKYQFTVTLTSQTSNNYKVKFRGYNTGTIYIDDVQIGPVDYEDVQQSGIYEVTVSQNGMTWPVNVFRNSCPNYQLGYQNMESKDQHPLDLFSGRTINWAKFNFNDPITVHVKVTDTNKVPVSGQTVNIYPSRHGVNSSTSGNVVTFTISEPGQYSVEIGTNGYKNGLMIFADPLETAIPSQSDPNYLVLYEADAGNISSISQTYSGVYFRRGVHNIDIWNIPSHIKNVYFEDGSWVYGALKMDGNPNVQIFGRGVLSSYKMNYRQTHCVEAINGSDNITIEGLVVADPKYFAIRLIGQNNNVSYAKVIGGWVYNCDGIAAFAGSTVSKCFIWANDDAIKAYRDSITFQDIVLWQLNNGGCIQMSWGGAIGGSTANGVQIKRVDVLHAEWDVDRFNVGLINCVGNHYEDAGRYNLLENWLVEDVVTETEIPLVWNISPDDYTHCHIEGLTMRDWEVYQNNSLGFQNRILGEDPNNFFSGFVFDNVRFNNGLLTNENRISSGEMDNGGWVGVPNGTNQVVSLASTFGTGNGWGLRSATTNMNGKPYYTTVCNDEFHITNSETITVSYWARATAAGKLLQPFVQDVTTGDVKWFSQVALTTNFTRYTSTFMVDQSTSDRYKLKFRGFETAWIFLDKVQVGRKDWISLTDISKQYLDTPTFLPELQSAQTSTSRKVETPIEFKAYPNPVSDMLYINSDNYNPYYKVYNQSGNIVLTGQGEQIDVSSLQAGFYILITEEGTRTKFVKK